MQKTTTEKREVIRKPKYTATGKDHHQFKHGCGSAKIRNPIYQKWASMKRRCLNKNDKSYTRYGGKGITVSKEWLDFRNFLADMGPSFKTGLSLDRIDNSKGYSKENCRWVPLAHQAKNKTNVPLYTKGKLTLTAPDWDRKLGLKPGTVSERIRSGWNVEKAITTLKKKPNYIFWDKARNKFRLEFSIKGKNVFIGRFSTEKEAREVLKKHLSQKHLLYL